MYSIFEPFEGFLLPGNIANFQHLQTSPDGNVTLSIINYVPSVRDAGKYMSCRAENPELPDSSLEDGWKLEIHCELCITCKKPVSIAARKARLINLKRPWKMRLFCRGNSPETCVREDSRREWGKAEMSHREDAVWRIKIWLHDNLWVKITPSHFVLRDYRPIYMTCL